MRPRRIAWAGPLSAASAIGRDGVRVAEALAARGADVVLVGTDYDPVNAAPLRGSRLPSRPYTEVDLPRLALDFDHVVVNLGDHFGNHAGAFPLLASAPCLAVVHDAYLANLFNGWLWWRGSQPGERERVTVETYGPEAAVLVRRLASGEMDLEEEAERLPMVEWAARQAAGCLAHSRFYVPRLAAACAGPVAVAGLPVESRGVPPLAPRPPDAPLTLLTVGMVNANKCVDRVVEALAASPRLRDRVAYRVVGPVPDGERDRLQALAARLGFTGLHLEGAATEARLEAALAGADMMACLRRPVLEGASGSVAEAMLAGRPTVVADAGCYADLPDDTVFKVPAEAPVAAVGAALERLAGDEPLRRALGARAREHAEHGATLDAYLAVLDPLMDATARAAPWLAAGRALGGRLAALGLTRDDPAVGRVARALAPAAGAA